MFKKSDASQKLSETLSKLPVGSVESRVAARRMLAERAPSFSIVFVGCRYNDAGELLETFTDSNRASTWGGDAEFHRDPNETLEAFTSRVHGALPALEPHAVIFWPARA